MVDVLREYRSMRRVLKKLNEYIYSLKNFGTTWFKTKECSFSASRMCYYIWHRISPMAKYSCTVASTYYVETGGELVRQGRGVISDVLLKFTILSGKVLQQLE